MEATHYQITMTDWAQTVADTRPRARTARAAINKTVRRDGGMSAALLISASIHAVAAGTLGTAWLSHPPAPGGDGAPAPAAMSVAITAPPAPTLPPVAPPPDPARKPPALAQPPPSIAPRIIATPSNPVVPVAFTVPTPTPIFVAKASLPVADSGFAEAPASADSAASLAASTNHIGSGPGSTNSVAQTVAITRARPDYDHNPPPNYPQVARLRGWHGTVILWVEVQTDGSAGEVGVVKSSGHQPLDEASAEAVRAWRFHPARVGDAAVRSRVEVPISFRLKKG
ncbi:MAG: energy transducer TonB [Verrucomicrobia bacterium]|nr:energy transducer TonB [Verrucomicrobiota bacterium]